jgi:predicted PurR-regulated permease PerM
MSNKYTPALVCGFGAAVFSTIPGLKEIACCMVVPLASLISILIYKKVNKSEIKIPTGTGLILGLLTGIVAAIFTSLFDVIITYITKTNDFIAALPQSEEMIKEWNLGPIVDESMKLMHDMAQQIRATGFSLLYAAMITMSNLFTHSIFGFLGGTLGIVLVNKRKS